MRSPPLAVGPEVLVFAIPVLADDRRRGVEDDLCRAVVAFELDGHGFGEIVFEVEQVPEVGAAPFVDRLIRIADDAEVAVDFDQTANQQILGPVGVLIFVHHDEPELRRVFRADPVGLLEEVDGLEEQIVEIEPVAVPERVHVVRVDLCDLFIAAVPAGGRCDLFGPFQTVLRLADARQGRSRLDEAVVDLEGLECLFDDSQLIGRIVDHKIAGKTDCRCFATEQARAQRVKRRHPHAPAVPAEQRLDARSHLFGCLVGEGDGEYFVRLCVTVADEVGDAAGNHARLARTGPRDDEQRSADVKDGFALFRVEAVEEGMHVETRG